MHHSFSITVPPAITEKLCQKLEAMDYVIGLTVQPGASRKPAGDVVVVQVLNRGADEVLRCVRQQIPEADISVATSELNSLIVPAQKQLIIDDKDEAIWEEMETGLRYQSNLTPNYIYLMVLAGIICAVGLVSDPVPQAVAFTASAVIGPGFDPVARIPLGVVLRHWPVMRNGLVATLVGYSVLVVAAWATTWWLLAAGETSAAELAGNSEVQNLAMPKLKELLVSVSGAAAGVVMLAAFRRSFLAGPLIAQAIIPAAALVGAALATGQMRLVWAGLERFGLDWLAIVVFGILVFGLKQRFVHRREPI